MRPATTSVIRVAIVLGASTAFAVNLASCVEREADVDRNTGLTPKTHEPHFPIAGGTHAGTDCNACHGDFDTFRQFSCVGAGCHPQAETDPKHTGNADYHYDGVACLSCHPRSDGEGSSVDHAKYFPIGIGTKHDRAGCAQCHVDSQNRMVLGCAAEGCHGAAATAPQHTGVGGYAWKSELCVRCHADGQVDRIAAHKPFVIRSKHNACLTCHPQSRTDKTWGEDWKPFSCLDAGCHPKGETDGHHSGRSGYKYESATCVTAGCHPTGRGG